MLWSRVSLVREMNASGVDQLMAVAIQSVTQTARLADTASCAASIQVSLAGPAGSLLTQAWYWSMRPHASMSTATASRESLIVFRFPLRTASAGNAQSCCLHYRRHGTPSKLTIVRSGSTTSFSVARALTGRNRLSGSSIIRCRRGNALPRCTTPGGAMKPDL
jgi:hypothetical protein